MQTFIVHFGYLWICLTFIRQISHMGVMFRILGDRKVLAKELSRVFNSCRSSALKDSTTIAYTEDYIVPIPETSPYTSDEEIESTPLAEHIKQRQEKKDIQIEIERLQQKLGR